MAKFVIPVVKSKGTVEFDYDSIPEDMLREAIFQGLKQMVNRGMSKITKSEYPDEATLKKTAQETAEVNFKAIMESDTKRIKLSGAPKSKKASGAVMTEAMRLARNLVKDELKRAGEKISHYEAKDITAAAKALIEQDESLLVTAAENLKAREAVPVAEKIDLKALIKASPKKVAEAEAKKAKAKETLSKTQAGQPAKRGAGKKIGAAASGGKPAAPAATPA